MKVYRRCLRKDSVQDHVHSIPSGEKTQGALAKPYHSSEAGWHTHLYMHEGVIHEAGPALDGPGHVHETILGDSSGPQSMPAKESFGPRNDSLVRIGREWQIRSDTGMVISRGATAIEAAARYDADEEYDEGFAKKAIDCMDEDLWSQAKAHSQAVFGAHKWPYVQHMYRHLGGA